MPRAAAPTCWAMCSSTSWASSRWRRARRAASSTPRAAWWNCWWPCWNRTRAACSTPVAAAAACSCKARSSSPSTRARSTTSASTGRVRWFGRAPGSKAAGVGCSAVVALSHPASHRAAGPARSSQSPRSVRCWAGPAASCRCAPSRKHPQVHTRPKRCCHATIDRGPCAARRLVPGDRSCGIDTGHGPAWKHRGGSDHGTAPPACPRHRILQCSSHFPEG